MVRGTFLRAKKAKFQNNVWKTMTLSKQQQVHESSTIHREGLEIDSQTMKFNLHSHQSGLVKGTN